MRSLEVNCISTSTSPPHHNLITHIGHSQLKWRIDIAQAIRCIDRDIECYYVVDRQRRQWVYLDVVREPGRPPYLRARTERGEWADNLLALPRCGPDCGAPPVKPCRLGGRFHPLRPCCTCRCR